MSVLEGFAISNMIQTIIIQKRNGSLVPFEVEKVYRTIQRACDMLDGCDPRSLEGDVHRQLHHEMSSVELMKTIIQVAVEKTSVEQPKWQFVAARLLLADRYKEAARHRGYADFGYGDFLALIERLEAIGRYGKYIRKAYTNEEIRELSRYMRPDRDFLFNYVGLKQLMDRYVIRGEQGETLELPQELFMGVAMHLAMHEADRVQRAKQFYTMCSQS